MNKFKKIIEEFGGEDKVLHFETCFLIVLLFSLSCIRFGMGQGDAAWFSCVLALIVGVLKEVYDSKHGGVFDGSDIGADALGAFAGVLIILILG